MAGKFFICGQTLLCTVSLDSHQGLWRPREATLRWAASAPDLCGYLISTKFLEPWLNKSGNESNLTGLCGRQLFQPIQSKSDYAGSCNTIIHVVICMGKRLFQHKGGHIASKEQRYKGENFANAYPILPKEVKYYLADVRILVATEGHYYRGQDRVHQGSLYPR